jgi:LysM repeat protein
MLPRMDTAGADDPRADEPRADSRSSSTRPEPQVRPSSAAEIAEAGVDPATPRGCPFLQSGDGGWRLGTPARDHRCAAFSPASPLSLEKQSRLCLTPAHASCATFLASMAAREARLGAVPLDRATRWGLARTTTVIEDPGGVRGRLVGLALDRRRWPAVPAVILVTTLFTLAISGFRAGAPSSAAVTATPTSAAATGTPAPRPSSTGGPTAEPDDTDWPSGAPSEAPTESPATAPTTAPATAAPSRAPAASFRTYRVVSGDTLSAIAGRYGTTVAALRELNNISDPSKLRVGQVLRIP